MAGKITDGKEDRLVFLPCFLKRFLAPRIPFHRIVGMQEQVGTLGMNEAVGVTILRGCGTSPRRLSRIGLSRDAGRSTKPFARARRGCEDKKQGDGAQQFELEVLY